MLMLFVIGLELDPKRLWTMRASVFGGGSIQMVGCGAVLSAFCYFLGLDWKIAMLIGLTLALSSTAIAMQAMSERSLTAAPIGRSAFAVLLFQDIAAIPLVAMIPLLASTGEATTLVSFGLSAAKVAGALVLVVLLGRMSRVALCILLPVPGCAKCSGRGLFLVLASVFCWKWRACRWQWAHFWRGFCWRVPNTSRAGKHIQPFKGLLLAYSYRRRYVYRLWDAGPSAVADCHICWSALWPESALLWWWRRGWVYRKNIADCLLFSSAGSEFAFLILAPRKLPVCCRWNGRKR